MPAPVSSDSTDRAPLARLGGAAVIVAAVLSAGVHVWVQPREPLPAIERAEAAAPPQADRRSPVTPAARRTGPPSSSAARQP